MEDFRSTDRHCDALFGVYATRFIERGDKA